MLSRTLFACASLVVAAVAQTSRIAFTVLPTNVTAGKPVTLQWGGGDGSVSLPNTLYSSCQPGTTEEKQLLIAFKGHHDYAATRPER